uniref:Uncharacterized protein n=1 Tax=Rhizophora mucronata TaxID=61149 RepID=A0A2P2JWD7_RHIMU
MIDSGCRECCLARLIGPMPFVRRSSELVRILI